MKKLGLLKTLGLAVVLTFSIAEMNAQEGKRKEERAGKKESFDPNKMAERRTNMMKEELSLNEETTAKVLKINKDFANQGKKLRDEAVKEEEARENKIKAMHEAHEAKIASVLSKEELEKFKAMKKEHKGKMAENRKGRNGKGPREEKF